MKINKQHNCKLNKNISTHISITTCSPLKKNTHHQLNSSTEPILHSHPFLSLAPTVRSPKVPSASSRNLCVVVFQASRDDVMTGGSDMLIVSFKKHARTHTHTYIYMCVCVYIYVCVCVCVCVWCAWKDAIIYWDPSWIPVDKTVRVTNCITEPLALWIDDSRVKSWKWWRFRKFLPQNHAGGSG